MPRFEVLRRANLVENNNNNNNNNNSKTNSNSSHSNSFKLIRDQAMEAFGIHNSMAHTTGERLKRKSATVTHMLQIVTKFFPTWHTKGNIAFSIWMQATKEGIVDTDSRVQQAFKETNVPSNGVEFDDLVHERCASNFVLPTKWIRHSKNRRHDAMVGTTNIC
jgi:hypothetical protein